MMKVPTVLLTGVVLLMHLHGANTRDSVQKFLPPSPLGDQLCLVPSSSFQFVILNMGLNHFGKQYTVKIRAHLI